MTSPQMSDKAACSASVCRLGIHVDDSSEHILVLWLVRPCSLASQEGLPACQQQA